MMSRVSVLEEKDRYHEKHRENVDAAIVAMSKDIREIRDVLIESNPIELSKRIAALEKSRWIAQGVAGSIGGAIGFVIAKLGVLLGVVVK